MGKVQMLKQTNKQDLTVEELLCLIKASRKETANQPHNVR